MPTRTDFTPDAWASVRTAPQLVAIATAAAGSSGLFGSLAEGMASASAMAEAIRGDQPLLRDVFAKDDVLAAQEQIKALFKGARSKAELDASLQKAAAETVSAAIAAVAAKGDVAATAGYRTMLRGVAEKVAQASKEGGFLGIGGERVSAAEREFLAKLDGVLGATPA